MKFEELIRLSNYLSNLTVEDVRNDAEHKFNHIMHRTDIPEAGIDSVYRQNIENTNQLLQDTFCKLEEQLNEYRLAVKTQVEKEGIAWLQKSYSSYEDQLVTKLAQRPDSVDLHRNKPIGLDEETSKLFRSRLAYCCDWHYPAMIIHPMKETFIQDMIGSDPLYIVDESQSLIDSATAQFNDVYKRRLRPYVIEESYDDPMLSNLPDGQFGVCFAYNYLNYRPFEIIKKYIQEIYQKLAPGGTLIMTFNDCDRWQSIQLVEQNLTCYTPGSLILGWAEYVGFEETFRYQDNSPSTWLELKKPGELTSLRGGQPLAKIIPKSLALSK